MKDKNKSYKDKSWLEQRYWYDGMAMAEIGNLCGCSPSTIWNWMNKLDIPTAGNHRYKRLIPEDVLIELYVDKKMALRDVGEKLGVSPKKVRLDMEHHGIPRRSKSIMANPKLRTYSKGYEVFANGGNQVYHHRLLAVSEWGFDAVKDMEIHHKNEIPWDNRIDNIMIVTPEQHRWIHNRDLKTLLDDI